MAYGWFSISAVVFLCGLVAVQCHSVSSTQTYRLHQELDPAGIYTLYWDFNNTHVTFEVHVKTLGYVGFGISPNGRMRGSDVVIGWVEDDGTPHFADRHATGNFMPEVDTSQDWFLIHAREENHKTILKFVRKLDTCDEDDLPITEQTIRLIYSWHPDDPTSEDNIPYHHANRGTKSVSLLTTSLPPASLQSDDVRVLDFRNRNYRVPNASTTYACSGHSLPNLGRKHQMIEFEPVHTPGNENNVHHIILSRCKGDYPHLDMVVTEHCYGSGWPRGDDCSIFASTGPNSQPYYFPEDAGMPLGNDGYNFFMMQMHYNNPEQRSDIIDSSGMRVKITSKLRQHDVAGLGIQHMTSTRQVIPPGEQAFITRAYCPQQCTMNALSDFTEEIKVIGVAQHAHLLGAAITTRQFRNGVELEPIIDDPYYDFNYQSIRPVRNHRTIKPAQSIRPVRNHSTIKGGDSFIVECTLNSMKRSKTTFGGLSTQEEMCMSYFLVYPAPPLINCNSEPEFDNLNISDIQGYQRDREIYNYFKDMDWDVPGVREEFKRKLDESRVYHSCSYSKNNIFMEDRYSFVENVKPFNRTLYTRGTCHK